MRRTGYNTLKNQTDQEAYDALDGHIEDVEEAKFIDCKTEEKPPYKTLCLVFFLFFVGMFTLIISSLIFFGHLDEKVYSDRMIPLMVLGLLMFIPGAYYARIVYCVVRGHPGYSYEMIPSCS